jgi:hypothetical protein
VQQSTVGLDVASLVDHLRRGVELGVHHRDLLDDLRRAHERTLLAMQELRELPALEVPAEGRLLGGREALEHARAEDRDRLVG